MLNIKKKITTIFCVLTMTSVLFGCSNSTSNTANSTTTNNNTTNNNTTSVNNTYTITWKNYDGSVLEVDTNVEYGSMPTYDGATPTKSSDSQYSYAFSGWSPAVVPATDNATYTATFSSTLEKAEILFDLNGGKTSHSTDSIYRSSIEVEDFFFDVTKENYNFRGWSYNGQIVFDQNGNKLYNPKLEPSMIFKAEFAQNVILTIKANIPNAGIVTGSGTYSYNTNVDVTATPYQGYSFVGWYYDNVSLSNQEIYKYMMWSKDITLEARFKINSYNLHVESAQPLLGSVSIEGDLTYNDESDKSVEYLKSISISAYTRTEQYRFLGWFDSSGKLVTPNAVYTFVMKNYDYNLYARWDAPSYNVTIKSNYPEGGYIVGGGIYEYNSKVTLTVTPNDGFSFSGWYRDELLVTDNLIYTFNMPADDVLLDLRFEPIEYEISYKLDGGTNSSNNPSSYNCTKEIILDSPTKIGYTFTGWKLNGNAITKIEKGTKGNLTLEAKWSINSYNVVVSSSDETLGTVSGIGTYEYGTEATVIATPKINGRFDGWYDEGNRVSTELVYSFIVLDHEINLEARWHNVLTIKDGVITGCENDATEVIISSSVTSIGSSAFRNCTKLQTVTFENRSKLESIGNSAFQGCSSLISITIPSSVTSIGQSAFNNCTNLQTITFESGSKLENIGSYAFYGCSSLTSIVIPSSVTSIGSYAFRDCSSLTSIVIPSNVTSIGEWAFSGCSSLTSITIPSSVTSIGNYAFNNCSSLTIYCEASSKPSGWGFNWNSSNRPVYWGINKDNYIVQDGIQYIIQSGEAKVTWHTSDLSSNVLIPNTITINGKVYSVTSIGDRAFYNCSSLTSIVIPSSVTSIESCAFYGCTNLQTVIFESGSKLESIGSYAFYNCSSLTSITIQSSVTSIGERAFYDCTNLQTVTFENGSKLESIGNFAFSDCSSLTSIVIPSSVTSIGSSAFWSCNSLTIYCEASSKPSGWNSSWKSSNRPVYWAGEWSYVNGVPTPNK